MSNLKDETGNKFGRLVVLRRGVNKGRCKTTWDCLCVCGVVVNVEAEALRRGTTRSCGCLRLDKITTHGVANKTEYKIWRHMLSRCNKPDDPAYPEYGGRGITVAEEWFDVSVFIADMGNRPSPLHSLDRVDNNKGYSKSNCRWATQTEQVRNRRVTMTLELNGITKPLAQWAEDTGLPYKLLFRRLKDNWGLDKLFSPPSTTHQAQALSGWKKRKKGETVCR